MNLRLDIGSHVCWKILYWIILLYGIMHWCFSNNSEVSIQIRHAEQGQKTVLIPQEKNQPSPHSSIILSDHSNSFPGGKLLVGGIYIDVSLISNGAYVLSFYVMYHVKLKTHLLVAAVSCVLSFSINIVFFDSIWVLQNLYSLFWYYFME